MKHIKISFSFSVVLGIFLVIPQFGAAQEAAVYSDTSESLSLQIHKLDQDVRILKRLRELDQEAAIQKQKDLPSIGVGKEGYSLQSADGSTQLKLRGYIQSDGRFFVDEKNGSANTFLLRRIRPLFEGTVFTYFDFRIMPDFGGGNTVIQDAYFDVRFSPAFTARFGKFKAPVGLERLQSGTDINFVERAFPTSLLPNRDVGIQFFGGISSLNLNYALAVSNGVTDGGSTDGDANAQKDISARIFLKPFSEDEIELLSGLGVGLAGTYGSHSGTLSGYKTDGQLSFFSYKSGVIADGITSRITPQGYYYYGSFSAFGEYVLVQRNVKVGTNLAKLINSARQLAISYVLTGGEVSPKGVKPKNQFNPANNTWGEVELTARFSTLAIDKNTFSIFADPAVAASYAEAWSIGINWYLNSSVKFVIDYEQTSFRGGAKEGNRPDEKTIFSRFQIAY